MEIEEAVSLLRKNIIPLSALETVPLSDAFGRLLSEDVFAPIAVPPFPKSAMDGYAVRAQDVALARKEAPVVLSVTGELFAGDWKEIPYKKNTAVRIMTGAPVPHGYDAVVMQEDTDYGEEKVCVYTPVRQFQNYCQEGEDIQKGSLVLSAGTMLSRTEVGLLASLGFTSVNVRAPARISVLCTGSELLPAGEPLGPGKIYANAGSMICCSIRHAGLSVSEHKIIADAENEICSALKHALDTSDLILTTGGVSVGKKDLLPKVLAQLGAKTIFSRVNIQPGTPTTASVLQNKVILSLSGNPFAMLVNFDMYFYHAAAVLMRSDVYVPKKTQAVLCSDYNKVNKRRRLVRAHLEGNKVFLPVQNHTSSVFSNLVDCNCYVDVPALTQIHKDETVNVFMMGL